MSIAILVPSKGRPEKCARMIKSAYETTSEKIHVYIAVLQSEWDSYVEAIKIPDTDRFGVIIVTMPESTTCYKWNRLADLAMRQYDTIFMLGSDDIIFSNSNWDSAILNAPDHKPHVYSLRDSRDIEGTPHPIVNRKWIEAMGWFLPPLFAHWFVDVWTVDIAKYNNCFTHLKEFLLIHDKDNDKGIPDETHNFIRRQGIHERDKFVSDKSQDILQMYKEKLKCAFG
jgi:hypothetical protein